MTSQKLMWQLSRTAAVGTGKMGRMRWWNWKMSRAGSVQGLGSPTMVAFSSLIWRKNGGGCHSDKSIMVTQWGLVWNADCRMIWNDLGATAGNYATGITLNETMVINENILVPYMLKSLRVHYLSIVKLFFSLRSVLNTAPSLSSRQGTRGLSSSRS